MPLDRTLVARQFPHAGGYLDTASVGLPPVRVVEAMRADLDAWQRGEASAAGYDRHVDGARGRFAALVGVAAERVAVGGQVSSFTGLVAASLPAGAKVLCAAEDFTSVLFPFLARGDLDVLPVPLDELLDRVDAAVDLVAVSAAQSADGRVLDLDALTAAAAAHDVRTFVDATQAAGWLDLDASRLDYLVAGAYKWLLAPRGTAFLAVAEGREQELWPVHAGWYAGEDRWDSIYGPPLRLAGDARRLDVSPAWLSWVGTHAALELIADIGVAAIGAHDIALANRLRAELGTAPAGSPIVSLPVDDVPPDGLVTSRRAGRLRVSFHLYNTEDDVDRLVERLRGGAGPGL